MAALTNKPRHWNNTLSIGFSVDTIVLRIIRSLNREYLLVGKPDTTDTSRSWKALEKLATTLQTFHFAVSVQPLSDNTLVLVKCEVFPGDTSH